jgi:hypothetical protein
MKLTSVASVEYEALSSLMSDVELTDVINVRQCLGR